VPESGNHSGRIGVSPDSSPTSGGRVIPDVAMPASEMGDAAPPNLLAPNMRLRLYRPVLGVVPPAHEDVTTSERLQQFLAMRPDLWKSWARKQRRGILTRLDTAAQLSADRGTGEAMHSVEPRSEIACHPILWWCVTLDFWLYFDFLFDDTACK